MTLNDDSREYHRRPLAGKRELSMTKPTNTQRDPSLAYSPGVAAPCRDIASDPELAYEYTTKRNLVGVVNAQDQLADDAVRREPISPGRRITCAMPAKSRFELYQDAAGEWRWRLLASNGNIIADSGEGYTSKQGAKRGVESVKRNAPRAEIDVQS